MKIGQPENWAQKLVPDSLKSQDPKAVRERLAGRLEPVTLDSLESSLDRPTPEAKASHFATGLQLGGDVRPLYAATVEGVEQIRQQANNPLVDLTAAVVNGGAHVAAGAEPHYLRDLTAAAQDGLKAYVDNPQGNPLELAARFEDSVGYVIADMAPVLTRSQPELKLPLEVFATAGEMGNTGEWLHSLAENPNLSLPQAFATVLGGASDDGQDFTDILNRLGDRAESPEIRQLADTSLERIEAGTTPRALLDEWNVTH